MGTQALLSAAREEGQVVDNVVYENKKEVEDDWVVVGMQDGLSDAVTVAGQGSSEKNAGDRVDGGSLVMAVSADGGEGNNGPVLSAPRGSNNRRNIIGTPWVVINARSVGCGGRLSDRGIIDVRPLHVHRPPVPLSIGGGGGF